MLLSYAPLERSIFTVSESETQTRAREGTICLPSLTATHLPTRHLLRRESAGRGELDGEGGSIPRNACCQECSKLGGVRSSVANGATKFKSNIPPTKFQLDMSSEVPNELAQPRVRATN